MKNSKWFLMALIALLVVPLNAGDKKDTKKAPVVPVLQQLVVTPNGTVDVYPSTTLDIEVSLPAMPVNAVTVKVSKDKGANSGIHFANKELKFTQNNWDIPQIITVRVNKKATEEVLTLTAQGYEVVNIRLVDPPLPVDPPPAPEPAAPSFVGTWDELFLNPMFFPWTGTYVVKDDGTCENWGGGIDPIRTGTWTVDAEGIVSVTWNDGNSATLVFVDADSMTGVDGSGISTIQLTRQ